jgi:hypothetical protein
VWIVRLALSHPCRLSVIRVAHETLKERPGLSPRRPNRKNSGTCVLYRQRFGECYPQQRMHIPVSSHGVSRVFDGGSVCG